MMCFDDLARLAPVLALGVTALLGFGLVLSMSRALCVRQVTAEWAVAAALVFVLAAWLPLPRPMALVDEGSPTEDEALPWRGIPDDLILDREAPAASRVGPVVDALAGADHDVEGAGLVTPAVEFATAGPLEFAAEAHLEPDAASNLATGAGASPWVARAYVVTAGGLALWLMLGWVRLGRLLRASTPASPTWCAWLAARAGGRRPPQLVLSASITRPFCFGPWRPRIVLPASLAGANGDAPSPMAAAAILHELAHVRRGDQRRALVFALALPLLFVHPLFWWLRRRARRAAEMVADAEAAVACGGRTGYARRLLDLVEVDGHLPWSVPRVGAVFMFRSPSELSERIEMLIHDRTTSRTSPRRAHGVLNLMSMAAATVFCVSLWGATPAPAQRTDDAMQELVRERDLLREELAALRRDIEAMRVAEAAKKGNTVEPDTTLLPATVEVAVRVGDSLWTIAKRHGSSVERIRALNPGLDPVKLRVGETILLPGDVVESPRDAIEPLSEPEPEPPSEVAQAPRRTPAPAPDGSDSILRLMTQLIDLEGAVEQAELRVQRSPEDRDAARIDLHTAVRKLDLVRRLIEMERQALQGDLEAQEEHFTMARKLREKGFVSTTEVRQQEAALLRLRAQLELLGSGSKNSTRKSGGR